MKKRIITMASNWASHQGQLSGESRQQKAQAKHLHSGRVKIMDTLAEQVPGAASILKASGVNDNEAWALVTHPDTLRGVKVIMETLGGVTKFLDKTEMPGKKKTKHKGVVPLIEYRE